MKLIETQSPNMRIAMTESGKLAEITSELTKEGEKITVDFCRPATTTELTELQALLKG